MATLNQLKLALRQKSMLSTNRPLSDAEYNSGFNIFGKGLEQKFYQDFIVPQLSLLLESVLAAKSHISILEVGPGPESVLGLLPRRLREKVEKYAAFEPNNLFAKKLEERFDFSLGTESPLPCVKSPADIRREPFMLTSSTMASNGSASRDDDRKFDVVLLCHSMYGMSPKHMFIRQAIEMLSEQPQGLVVVFHRDGIFNLDGLACHKTAYFSMGDVHVADDDEVLDHFAPFIAGFAMRDLDTDLAVKAEWRRLCRSLSRREKAHPGQLFFSAPDVMMGFTRHATALPELRVQVPEMKGNMVKNREARLHRPATVIRPTEIKHIQQCVGWALKHNFSLTVIGGGHSGHCLWPGTVAIDMGAFNQIHIASREQNRAPSSSDPMTLVVVETGCKSGDIIQKTMAAGLTVPMGSRPSVGAGLWLQGGIGHLARLHGLTCDAVVGAVMVSVANGQLLWVGHVPSKHRPVDAVRLENDTEVLWGMKGAGTNFGIVVSIAFRAHVAPSYSIRNWIVPLDDRQQALANLSRLYGSIAKRLPRNCSVDAYLYSETDKLHLGISAFEVLPNGPKVEAPETALASIRAILGPENSAKTVDGIGLFETEMYMSGMHGAHGAGKTSSFKRCLFLKRIGSVDIASILLGALETRPSPFCYLHLLQGGGAVSDAASDATAFGCRDWDYACVITGVWPRDQDGTKAARNAMQWVYDVVKDLLPLSIGAYGADLGPDSRDAELARKAFGPNLLRLGRLKRSLDPSNVLAYACPLPRVPAVQRLVVLVTGESCTGKDYCADVWAAALNACNLVTIRTRAVSISEATKQEYAAASGANLERLLHDRAYKEQHRAAVTAHFQDQVRQRPRLPEEHFLNVLRSNSDVDVLFLTGLRDKAPVATFSPLVPDTRLIEVCLKASKETREARGGRQGSVSDRFDGAREGNVSSRPSFVFVNDTAGSESAIRFGRECLLPYFHRDLQRLADMVHLTTDFPRPGIEFCDVLGLSQQPGGLTLCVSLLNTHFAFEQGKVDAVACCETGGFVFASALAVRLGARMVLMRDAGKLPPPTISAVKSSSHISSSTSSDSRGKRIEMGRNVVPNGSSVLVVDDVLATGKTLCAVLQLLGKAGIDAEDVSVLIVAEFPVHGGRELLRRHGFGGTRVRSLLIFGGA